MLEVIDEAEQFVVLDMFLFNDYRSVEKEFPELTKTLTDRLITARKARGLDVHVITDQVNLTYGAHAAGPPPSAPSSFFGLICFVIHCDFCLCMLSFFLIV